VAVAIILIAAGVLAGMWVVVADLPAHSFVLFLTFGAPIATCVLIVLDKQPEWSAMIAVFLLPFLQARGSLKIVYVALIVGAALWLFLTGRLKLYRDHLPVLVLVLYLSAIALTIPVLPVPFDIGSVWEEVVRYGSNLLLFLTVSNLAQRRPWLEYIVLALFLSATIAALIGILTFGNPILLSADQRVALRPQIQQGRAFSTLGHPNLNGQFSTLALLILVGVWAQLPFNRKKAVLTAGLELILVNLLLTGSRGALAGFGFGLAVIWFLVDRRKRARLSLWAVALAVPGILVFAVGAYSERWGKLVQRLLSSLDTSQIIEELSLRPDLWQVAWQAFLSSPLWGVGPLNLSHYFYRSGTVLGRINQEYLRLLQAHNLYLQFLAATGILGMLALATVFFSLLRRGCRAIRSSQSLLRRGVTIGAVAALTSILVTGLVQTVLGKGWSTWQMFFVVLALLASAGRVRMTQKELCGTYESSSGLSDIGLTR
jgi:O-antigen ligase